MVERFPRRRAERTGKTIPRREPDHQSGGGPVGAGARVRSCANRDAIPFFGDGAERRTPAPFRKPPPWQLDPRNFCNIPEQFHATFYGGIRGGFVWAPAAQHRSGASFLPS